VQASASNPIILSDQNLTLDEQITMTIRPSPTPSTNDPTNTNLGDATLHGTTEVQLACTTADCTTPLPGTVEFVSCNVLMAGICELRARSRGRSHGQHGRHRHDRGRRGDLAPARRFLWLRSR
jgi:hypothetical protein